MSNEYLERIISIRKNTGLNQEQFFFKYLKDAKKSVKTGSSAQNYMKKIENGSEQLTVPELMVYAELGNCSLDQLVYGDSGNDRQPKDISCADIIRVIDKLRKIGAIELELSQKDRPMRWGSINAQPEETLPKELPVESVSIWIENAPLSFELKEYLQVVSIENAATISRDVSEQLLKLWFESLKKRNNTITEGHSVTDARQDAYIMGHR